MLYQFQVYSKVIQLSIYKEAFKKFWCPGSPPGGLNQILEVGLF